MTLPHVPPLPRCECGREVWSSLLIGAQCTVCLDTMRLNDALAELERHRAKWVADVAIYRHAIGHEMNGTFRVPADEPVYYGPFTFPVTAEVARIAQTIAECRADIEAAGGTW